MRLPTENEWSERAQIKGMRSLPISAALWFALIYSQWLHRDVVLHHQMMEALTGQLKRKKFGKTDFDMVKNMEHVLDWLEDTVIPPLWAVGPDGKAIAAVYSRGIGGLRIQTVGKKTTECEVSGDFLQVYNMTCYTDSTEYTDTHRPMFASNYKPDTYWLDYEFSEAQAITFLKALNNASFAGSEFTVKVQALVLNGQVSQLAFMEARFDIKNTGLLKKKITMEPLPTKTYESFFEYLMDFFLFLMIVVLAGVEVYNVVVSCKQGHGCKGYLRPMAILNWAVVVGGVAFSTVFIYIAYYVGQTEDMVASLPAYPDDPDNADRALWESRYSAMDTVFDDVQSLAKTMRWSHLSTFWYSLLILLKFFEAFDSSPRLAVMTQTLRRCATDLTDFAVILVFVYLNFALGGYFLFGHQLSDWSTVTKALNSGFRAVRGDYSFQDMYDISPISAVMWFWLFTILLVMLLMNMFMAIVMDAYAGVKGEAKKAESLWATVSNSITRSWDSLTVRSEKSKSIVRPEKSTAKGARDDDDVESRSTKDTDSETVGGSTPLEPAGGSARVKELEDMINSLSSKMNQLDQVILMNTDSRVLGPKNATARTNDSNHDRAYYTGHRDGHSNGWMVNGYSDRDQANRGVYEKRPSSYSPDWANRSASRRASRSEPLPVGTTRVISRGTTRVMSRGRY